MRFGVLGPLEVRTDAGKPVRVRDRKVRALLADLLAHGGATVPAARLIDDLWGAALPADPAATLQARVSQLRRALDDAEPGARALVASRPPGYALAARTDAAAFTDLVARGAHAEALALWRGEPYEEFADEPFTAAERARLTDLYLTAAERHPSLDLAPLVAAHPLRESLAAAHLRALAASGRRADALTAYETLRRHLRDTLGVDPSPPLRALHAALLRQDEAAAVRGAPVAVSSLVGRDGLVAEVRAMVDAGPLVTLAGAGGVGKTRVAMAVAGAVGAHWADLVPLSAGASGGDLRTLLARTLGLRDEPGRDAVAAALRGRVLVLDNCEHVLDAVAAVVPGLLRGGVTVLATSREPLGVEGERVRPVPPLAPDDAGALFRERAAAAAPGFDAEPGVVALICRRLDGLPLALELAASRVRGLSAEDLAARLDDRFALLSAGRRDAPARQRTLRAVLDWSWEPLPEPERAALRRLAVHAGGCTLDAAERVGGATADVLARLVDRSLVVHADGRYRLLESVAAYALERLREAGEEDATRARHRAYYADLAAQADRGLRGPGQGRWLRRLDAEAGNLAALRDVEPLCWYWFLRGRVRAARTALTEPKTARQVVWALAFALLDADAEDAHGDRTSPGRGVERGGAAGRRAGRVAAALAGVADADRAWALWLLASVRSAYGDTGAVAEDAGRALEAFTASGDRWGTAAAHTLLAAQAHMSGELAEAARHGEQGAALFADVGDGWGRMQATETLAALAETTGDYPRAARLHEEAVTIAGDLDLPLERADRLARLGRVALLTGDGARADDLHRRAAALAAAHGDVRREHFADVGLALAARRRGDLDTAETILTRWLPWCRAIDGRHGLALLLAELGYVAEQRGDTDRAGDLHREGLATARATGNPRAVALAREGLAAVAARTGHPEEARRLLAAAARARAASGAPLPPAERHDVDRTLARLARGGPGPDQRRSSPTRTGSWSDER
ncbi:BTAD domain-containing putative transcriptional regulator [Actinomadura flavalba]|uniref:BTAD domain-containing putative transcriptional regulator n=1 Tax=Actinomadura flavalba TaxID=1120938 RepID=UPI0003717519|nr:BTAD domain-containing putative transcriptional regulator [Actinomadura flavalba]